MNKKNLLVLGGTQMLGRDFVETIKNSDEYNIYLANRGLTNREIFDLPRINIDRNNEALCYNLSYIKFHTVIDFSCYNLNQFTNTFRHIRYNKYVLISTQSVLDRSVLDSNRIDDAYFQYCFHKNQVEGYILSSNIENLTIVRPCAVYGPNDYTNRFELREDNEYYWKNTNIKANKDSGSIYIKDFTEQLVRIVFDNFSSNSIMIYNIG